jgi:hypothetical protein
LEVDEIVYSDFADVVVVVVVVLLLLATVRLTDGAVVRLVSGDDTV